MKIAGSYISIIFTLLLSGCHTLTAPVSTAHSTGKPYTESTALTIYEAHPLKGSERVSVHAYSYTRGSDFCSRTIALKFSSELPYTQTLIAMRNRALVTGANALSITGWEEKDGITTFTGHFFDCHSKKGL